MAKRDCLAEAVGAAGGKLSKEEINAAVEAADRHALRLQAEGKIDGIENRLRAAILEEADRTRVAAALQRKHAALNAIVRDRLNTHVAELRSAGLSHQKAVLAVMEGTSRAATGGRASVDATKLAYEQKFIGSVFAEIARERPHVVRLIDNKAFNDDVVREMVELREGGKPGSTGNEDAKAVARIFATHSEVSRQELNRLGANIGKLDGWAGPQIHDAGRLLRAGEKPWVEAILPRLDMDKTFPDLAADKQGLRKALSEVYTTLVTGEDRTVGAVQRGERVGPANLAKTLGRNRVLHFKSADDWIAYKEQFGQANIFPGMIAHLRQAASLASRMEVLGPNPDIMLRAFLADMRKQVRDDKNIPHGERRKIIDSLSDESGKIVDAMAEMNNLTWMPVAGGWTAAKINSGIRSIQTSSKLGSAIFSSLPTDPFIAAGGAAFRGSGFTKALTKNISGMLQGRPKGEQQQIAFLLGEGFDGYLQHNVRDFSAGDAFPGMASIMASKVLKWSGLFWQSDVARSVTARMVAAEGGMRASTGYDKLPTRYRHYLGLHGIDKDMWEAMRNAAWVADNGTTYLTPDRIARLPDSHFAPVAERRLAELPENKRTDALRERYTSDARRDAEMAWRRLVSDETRMSVVLPDAQTRRVMLRGTRPGTLAGEAMRYFWQVKSFTTGMLLRPIARHLMGGPGSTARERLMNGVPHLAQMIVGMTIGGYAAMTLKDVAKGKWPPRDISDPKTLAAAFTQGGGAGIAGDFLFAQTNRFGQGPFETFGGPTVSEFSSLIKLVGAARDGDAKAGTALNQALRNLPGANLWWARAGMDYLIANRMREIASPGYMRRSEQRRRQEYNQQSLLPRFAF